MAKTMALTIEEADDTLIIRKDGVEIDLGPNHSVVVHTDGDVKVQPAAANETAVKAAKTAFEVGDRMQDDSIFAGISPDTGKQMFAMPGDASVSKTFNEAAQYAKALNAYNSLGHDDWRVPTKAELNVLFENREKGALKGTFNVTGSDPDGYYWSSWSHLLIDAYDQNFSDGTPGCGHRTLYASVRCVR